jgi:hypothetical protein
MGACVGQPMVNDQLSAYRRVDVRIRSSSYIAIFAIYTGQVDLGYECDFWGNVWVVVATMYS